MNKCLLSLYHERKEEKMKLEFKFFFNTQHIFIAESQNNWQLAQRQK